MTVGMHYVVKADYLVSGSLYPRVVVTVRPNYIRLTWPTLIVLT